MMTRKALAVGVLTISIFGGTAHAAGDGWTRYRTREHAPNGISRVVIRSQCIGAEDSASHLRLKEYGDGRAVYGCERKGY